MPTDERYPTSLVTRLTAAAVWMMVPLGGCADGAMPTETTAEGSITPAASAMASAGSSAATTNSGAAARAQWVGVVEGTDVRMAMIVGPGKARVYFCGGELSYANATRWIEFPYDGGEHIEFEDGDWHLHGHLLLARLKGEVELGDHVERAVRADVARPGTLAGLYEGEADCGRVGLIVIQSSGAEPALAQGACTNLRDASSRPIEAILPVAAEAGGIRVRLSDDSDTPILLHAATLDP